MALAQFLEQLDELVASATAALNAADDTAALEAVRVEYVGAKKGRLKTVQKSMGQVDPTQRPLAGKRLNDVKAQIEQAFVAAQERLGADLAGSRRGRSKQFDSTLPGHGLRWGRLHPITQTIEELKEIMGRLGFSVAEGPEIEDEWHNFEALNIPLEHPARDPLDNFYLSAAGVADGSLLLRSQTSTVQIRVMEKTPPPVRIISLGRVYRPDTADATHYPMFHQMEGLLIDCACDDGRLEERPEDVCHQLSRERRSHSLQAVLLPVHRAERGGRFQLEPAMDRVWRGGHGRPERAEGGRIRSRASHRIRLRAGSGTALYATA